jgi:hypothetical protein
LYLKILGALFVVRRLTAQVQRLAAIGFGRPIEPSRGPLMPRALDGCPPRGMLTAHLRPHVLFSRFARRAIDLPPIIHKD